MYAQNLEGESWKGERMDPSKIEKMSGKFHVGKWLAAHRFLRPF